MSDNVVDSSMADGVAQSTTVNDGTKEDPQFLRKRSVQMEDETGAEVTAPPGTATSLAAESPEGAPSLAKKMSRKGTSKRASIAGSGTCDFLRFATRTPNSYPKTIGGQLLEEASASLHLHPITFSVAQPSALS